MRKLAFLLGLVLSGGTALAQDLHSAPLFLRYDVTSGSTIYGLFAGQNGSPFAAPIQGPGRAVTSGASTTVTEFVSGELPFSVISVGDEMSFVQPANVAAGTVTTVLVTAKASGASITVDTSVNLTGGVSFRYMKASQGTTSGFGWIPVATDGDKAWSWTIGTINATNITVSIQCIDDWNGAPAVTVYPPVTTQTDTCFTGIFTAVKTCKFVAPEPYAACRFGMLITGDVGTQSVTAGYQGRKKGS